MARAPHDAEEHDDEGAVQEPPLRRPLPAAAGPEDVAGNTPAPADTLNQLALALQSLMSQAPSTTSMQPRPYVPDFRKDLNMTTWPSYSGDFRTFRIYKKDVLFTLGMLPPRSACQSSSLSYQSICARVQKPLDARKLQYGRL